MLTNTCICFPLHLPVSLTPTVAISYPFTLPFSFPSVVRISVSDYSLSLHSLWEACENASPLNVSGYQGDHWFAVTPQSQGLIGGWGWGEARREWHWGCQTDRWALGLGGVIEGHGGRCGGDRGGSSDCFIIRGASGTVLLFMLLGLGLSFVWFNIWKQYANASVILVILYIIAL